MNTCPQIQKHLPPFLTPQPCTIKTSRRSTTPFKQVSIQCRAISGIEQQQPKSSKGDGGSKGPPIVNNGKFTEEGDEGGQEEEVEAILVKEGVEIQQLPQELQQALAKGLVGAKDVQQWLAVVGTPIIGWICQIWPGFRERVLGNPRFLLALAIEEVIGCSAKFSAEIKTRGDNFNNELHFVASDMVLEFIGDFFLVWLLSPKRSWKAPPSTGVMATIAKLPAHAFQKGNFSLGRRFGSFFYRSFQFFMVGFLSSVLGHSFTVYMVERQKRLNPTKSNENEKELAPVLDNSLAWGSFLAWNATTRYNLVNGFEEHVIDGFIHQQYLKTLAVFTLRFANTFAGGNMWIWYARVTGIQ
eukprot:TRINITY_DN24847_c0_g2_i1.p1 TRINITY_DN24847_c0_g2~~TRINITY_DN24847_c0_g2_i1.p1  ORF type:complete len:356 (-),score=45.18 TRINITY_DN24847_c0_g2_i1:214-1281(-)